MLNILVDRRGTHSSSRMRNQELLRFFQGSYSLFPRNSGKVLQEVVKRMPSLQVIEKCLYGHTSADKNGRAAKDLRVAVDDCIPGRHDHILALSASRNHATVSRSPSASGVRPNLDASTLLRCSPAFAG